MSWGGAIELTILANHFETEIASIDVETGRIDHFTPSEINQNNSGNRCILIYSGIHYDAVSLAPIEDVPPEFHQTRMPVMSYDPQTDFILNAAKKLADKLRQKRAYTNTATFTLKCEVSFLFLYRRLDELGMIFNVRRPPRIVDKGLLEREKLEGMLPKRVMLILESIENGSRLQSSFQADCWNCNLMISSIVYIV
jgi:hypothetical protein